MVIFAFIKVMCLVFGAVGSLIGIVMTGANAAIRGDNAIHTDAYILAHKRTVPTWILLGCSLVMFSFGLALVLV